MIISLADNPLAKDIDGLVIPVFQIKDRSGIKDKYPEIYPLLKKKGFEGKPGENMVFFWDKINKMCVILGMGDPKNLFHSRKGARHLIPLLTTNKIQTASLHLVDKVVVNDTYMTNFLDYLFLNVYHFDRYLSKKNKKLRQLKIVTDHPFPITLEMIQSRKKITEGVNWVRDLVNDVPSKVTPSYLVDCALQLEKDYRLQVNVSRTSKLKSLGLNGILAVGQASPYEPALIQCLHEPEHSVATIALVGKGITFDSGGLNIKTGNYMMDMKQDMAGAAVVLGVMRILAEIKLPVTVFGFAAVAENMPGQSAYKPGDVITFKNKKTVEVINTDAEGRLALADALIVASEKRPVCLIELSTLTGVMHNALGDMFAGLFGSNKKLNKRFLDSAERTGDLLCEFPMIEDYKESIRSKIADLKNADYRGASAIKAGLFLKEFTKKVPFVHIDIASTAFLSQPNSFYSRDGATGFGIRLLLDFFTKLCLEKA